jgi:hypothetical protein
LQGFSPNEGQLFAEFDEGFELFAFRGPEKTFVVAVHQFLESAVGLRRK